MKVIKYETSLDEISKTCEEMPTVFLAGPTVRGHQTHLTSWRIEAVKTFEELGFDGAVILPEFTVSTESDKGKKWIPLWEFHGLKNCGCIMFWVPRTKELIGLTTNYELGYWTARDHYKVIYGRPDDAHRIDYPDIMWHVDSIDEFDYPCATEQDLEDNPRTRPIYSTLRDTVSASMYIAKERYDNDVAAKETLLRWGERRICLS